MGLSTSPSPGTGPNLRPAARRRWQRLFPARLYVEIQRHGLRAEQAIEPRLLDLAYRASLPLVATNEVFFAAASDYEAHDALICIAEGTVVSDGARRQLSPEHRFKTRAEMIALFRGPSGSHTEQRRDRACAAPTGR